MTKLRVTTPKDLQNITSAIQWLRFSRDHLRTAGAKRSASYVARALKSAEGGVETRNAG